MSLSTVTALQTYILGNSYIKVFSLDEDYAGHRETVHPPFWPPACKRNVPQPSMRHRHAGKQL